MEPGSHLSEELLPFVSGDKVAFGPLRRELLPLYQRWFGDVAAGVTYFIGALIPETAEGAVERYERYTKLPGAARAVGFTIYERATARPIGTAGLGDLDFFNRTAEVGLLIGERECWGRGYGTETLRLLLDYGFTVLGLHAIRSTVLGYNERSLRAHARAGFRVAGRWREAKRLGERGHDIVLLDCLAGEFQSPVLHRLLPEP